ncbi:kxDL motif-containing protein 1-like [Engraulis encrasicolus]|uniref:kxDL motif-containing protein 1-like n=1 Tax=Engraulis encrasicolus TaxID=184585 RepID=UPI002FD11C0E
MVLQHLNQEVQKAALLGHLRCLGVPHPSILLEMKKDLDSIFRKIRALKGKVAKQYPDAFSTVHESPILEDEDEDFDPVPSSVATTTTTTATSEHSTESCNSSTDVVFPTVSRCSEDLSQEQPETPTLNSPPGTELKDKGPD